MDNEFLQKLVEEAKSRAGGMVLHVGEKPEVVVLTMDKYNELMAGAAGVGIELVQTTEIKEEVILPAAPVVKEKILVTGGAGYIGSHTVRTLLDAGYEVVVVDNLSTGNKLFVPEGVPFYEGDIRDKTLLGAVFTEHAISAVMHFAARIEVNESVSDPVGYGDVNIYGTWQLLQAMIEAGVKKIIFSSTAAVYGDGAKIPIAESAEINPNNPYGASKYVGERLIEYFARSMDFRAVVLRYFNASGCNGEWGLSFTNKRSHLIPIILEVAAGKRDVLTVHGADYSTFDGTCIRDFVHVMDIAQAHVLALQNSGTGERFKVFNVGTGKGTSVAQIIAAVAEHTERMVPMEIGPRRVGDAEATVADAQKIQSELGFVPQYSTLESIIKSSWQVIGGRG